MPCAFGAREEDTAPSLAMAHASRGPRMAQKARFSYVVSYRALQTSFVSGIVTSQTRQDTRAVSRDVRKRPSSHHVTNPHAQKCPSL